MGEWGKEGGADSGHKAAGYKKRQVIGNALGTQNRVILARFQMLSNRFGEGIQISSKLRLNNNYYLIKASSASMERADSRAQVSIPDSLTYARSLHFGRSRGSPRAA